MTSSSLLSQSRYLPIIASAISIIPLGFGVNALLRPRNAFEFFEFETPASAADQKLIDGLMLLYGARDVLMSAAIFVTAFYGHRKALGWIMVAVGAVAGVDGYVVRDVVGRGEWTHWGYAPGVITLGALLLGVLG